MSDIEAGSVEAGVASLEGTVEAGVAALSSIATDYHFGVEAGVTSLEGSVEAGVASLSSLRIVILVCESIVSSGKSRRMSRPF